MDENKKNVNKTAVEPQVEEPQAAKEQEPPTPSRRDALKQRLQERYPDDSFDDDEVMAGRVLDDYDDLQQRHDALQADQDKLNKLFGNDPKAAAFMQRWIEGGDPAVELVRVYGSDELRDALDDPEKQDALAEASKEYAERVAKDKEFEQKYQQNLSASLDEMDAFQQSEGLSDDEMDGLLTQLAQSATDFISGKITTEALNGVLRSTRYSADVENAEREGEVRGRNQKIDAKLKKRTAGDGVPELGSQNQKAEPKRKSMPELGALEQASNGGDIWAGLKRTRY